MSDSTYHPDEPHGRGHRAQLHWLRAGVLGANDGIVSIAAGVGADVWGRVIIWWLEPTPS